MFTRPAWPTVCLAMSLTIYGISLAVASLAPGPDATLSGVPNVGAHVPELNGYAAPFRPVSTEPRGRCTLVHFSAKACEFCRREAPIWKQAAARAGELGCNVTNIGAFAGALPLANYNDGAGVSLPLVFVPLNWAEVVPLYAAPTTLLLDRENVLVWRRVGTMDPESYRSLTEKLTTLWGRQ